MKRACFGAFVVPTTDAHITIVTNDDASNLEITQIQQDMERFIRPHLPITIQIGNFIKLGEHGTVPAYACTITDANVMGIVAQFYKDRYNGARGKRLYPIWEPHITVDTPERLGAIENIIYDSRGIVQITETIFKTHSDHFLPEPARHIVEHVPLVKNIAPNSANPTNPTNPTDTWKCAECHIENSIRDRECRQPGCDQWRPKAAIPRRKGDWECCGDMQFGSRSTCRHCGGARPNSNASSRKRPLDNTDNSIYANPPPSAPAYNPAAPQHRRRGSWDCSQCGDHQFSKNTTCRMCGNGRVR